MGRIRRRQFLFATSALLAARLVHAQQPPRKIGWLISTGPKSGRAEFARNWASDALPRLGYEEGKNFRIEWRYAEGQPDRLPALAQELVRLRVDLIVANGNEASFAAKQATQTIPIVVNAGFVVESGLVQSLARPGGNITGLDWVPITTLQEKTYQLLKEVSPTARRVVTLWDPQGINARLFNAEFDRVVSAKTGMAKFRVGITRPEDLKRAFEQIDSIRPDVLFVGSHEAVSAQFPYIAAFAQEQKMPSISDSSRYAGEGGLLAYAADPRAMYKRLGSFIDRILRGAKPGDLPVEQPTKFELVLNMKTAKAMGLKLPPSLMLQVDRTIE